MANGLETELAKSNSDSSGAHHKVDQKVLSVLQGDLTNCAIFKAKIVRIFISSTFTGNEAKEIGMIKHKFTSVLSELEVLFL